MAKPKGIKFTKQRHDWDCGVASLAMLLGKPYGDVAAIVKDTVDKKKLRRRGMTIKDVQDVAEIFGMPLEVIWRKKDYLIGQTGIIGLKGGGMDKAGHWAVVKNEVIADPDDNSFWSVEDYKKKHDCVTTVLLVPIK